MKIEMDETTSFTAMFCTVAVMLSLTALGGCYMVETTTQKAIAAGLIQKEEPMNSRTIWTKPDPKKQ